MSVPYYRLVSIWAILICLCTVSMGWLPEGSIDAALVDDMPDSVALERVKHYMESATLNLEQMKVELGERKEAMNKEKREAEAERGKKVGGFSVAEMVAKLQEEKERAATVREIEEPAQRTKDDAELTTEVAPQVTREERLKLNAAALENTKIEQEKIMRERQKARTAHTPPKPFEHGSWREKEKEKEKEKEREKEKEIVDNDTWERKEAARDGREETQIDLIGMASSAGEPEVGAHPEQAEALTSETLLSPEDGGSASDENSKRQRGTSEIRADPLSAFAGGVHLEGMLETLSKCQAAQAEQVAIEAILTSGPLQELLSASLADHERGGSLPQRVERALVSLSSEVSLLSAEVGRLRGVEKQAQEALTKLDTMIAKTKIAKNEQMAASLTSENSKLECEVQIGAHRERISLLEAELSAVKSSAASLSVSKREEGRSVQQEAYVASMEKELYMAREQLSKYKGLRRTHMARDDDRIVGVMDPPRGSIGTTGDEVCPPCSCDLCSTSGGEGVGLEGESGCVSNAVENDGVTATACVQLLGSRMKGAVLSLLDSLVSSSSGADSDGSMDSSTLSSRSPLKKPVEEDLDDLAKWERLMDSERRRRMNELAEEGSDSTTYDIPSKKAPDETVWHFYLTIALRNFTSYTQRLFAVVANEVLLLLSPLHDWIFLPLCRGFVYAFGSGSTPFDAKRAALAYARYRGADVQQGGESSYAQAASTAAGAAAGAGTSDEGVDLAAWEALLIVESYFSDSLYWLPDWAERLYQLAHGFVYYFHRALFDHDSLHDFFGSVIANITFSAQSVYHGLSWCVEMFARSPVGGVLEHYVGGLLFLPLCWLLIVTALLLGVKMAITSTRRFVRLCLGICSAVLVVVMLPLVLVSWLLGVKKNKTGAPTATSPTHGQQSGKSTAVVRGGALSSNSRDTNDSGEGGVGSNAGYRKPAPLIMTPSYTERQAGGGNSRSSTPSQSNSGRTVNEGILSALRERERVQRHVATQQQQQLLNQQVVPMMAVRPSPQANSGETPLSRPDSGDSPRNLHSTESRDISVAAVSPADASKSPAPTPANDAVASPPHRSNPPHAPSGTNNVPHTGGQPMPVGLGGRGVLVTPRSHLRQLLAEEQAQVNARREKQERLAAKVESEQKARERSLLPNVSSLVPSFLGGGSTTKEVSTSLIEERIAEMTNPRALNIRVPDSAPPISSAGAPESQSPTSPFAGLPENQGRDQNQDHYQDQDSGIAANERTTVQTGGSVGGGGDNSHKSSGSSGSLGSTVATLSPEYLAQRAAARLEETSRREQEQPPPQQRYMTPSAAATSTAPPTGNKLAASRVLEEAVQREASSRGSRFASHANVNSLQSGPHDEDGTSTDPGQWSDMTSPMSSAGNITPKNAAAYYALQQGGAATQLPPVAESASFREDSVGEDPHTRKERVISELISKIRSTSEQSKEAPEHVPSSPTRPERSPRMSNKSPVPSEINVYGISDDTASEDGDEEQATYGQAVPSDYTDAVYSEGAEGYYDEHGQFHYYREYTPEELAAWETQRVEQGEQLPHGYDENGYPAEIQASEGYYDENGIYVQYEYNQAYDGGYYDASGQYVRGQSYEQQQYADAATEGQEQQYYGESGVYQHDNYQEHAPGQDQGQYAPQQHQAQVEPEGYYDGDGIWRVFPSQPMVSARQETAIGHKEEHETYPDDFEEAGDTRGDSGEAAPDPGDHSHEQPSTSFGDELAASGEHDNEEYDPLEHSDMLDYSLDVPGGSRHAAPQSPQEFRETTLSFNTVPSASHSPAGKAAAARGAESDGDLTAGESPIKAVGPALDEEGEEQDLYMQLGDVA